MSKTYWVRINNNGSVSIYKDGEQSGETWKQALSHARSNKNKAVITCLCVKYDSEDTQKRRLKVSYLSNRDTYHLSSWPLGGKEHKQDCRFYSYFQHEAVARTYMPGVLTTTESGNYRIRIPTRLQQRDTKNITEQNGAVIARGEQAKRPNMSLLGLMHFLWEQMQFNVWVPGDERNRIIERVAYRLSRRAKKIEIGRRCLADNLLVPTSQKEFIKANNEKVNLALSNKQRLIFVSKLAPWTEKREAKFEQGFLPLSYFEGFPRLNVDTEACNILQNRWIRQINAWEKITLICKYL